MRNFPAFEGPMHSWPRVEPILGIGAVLEMLRCSFTIALATNAADSNEIDIRQALNRCELSDCFDHIFCFRQVGHRKPDPPFFTTILDTLRLPPSSVYMVGDSFEDDVRAANELGISAVWFNPGADRSDSGPLYCTVRYHRDLPSALRQLGATGF